MVSSKDPGGRATTRASSCVQNGTNSAPGMVGNELHSRQVLSFRKEGIAQAGLLTVQNERVIFQYLLVLPDPCSPVLLTEDIAVEPWMPVP